MNQQESKGFLHGAWNALDTIGKAAWPLVCAAGVWGFNTLRDHDQRLAKIEASSITEERRTGYLQQIAEHGEQLRGVRLELNGIQIQLNRIFDKLDKPK